MTLVTHVGYVVLIALCHITTQEFSSTQSLLAKVINAYIKKK